MHNKYFLLLALFSILYSVVSQTPEQRYFEWTSLPFSKEELAQRRNNLMAQLPKNAIALIPSRDGFSSGETFRQLDDFYYFTGMELPNSMLVIDVAENSATVYVPERDLRFESSSRPNDFPGRPLLYDATITDISGLPMKNIAVFHDLIQKRSHEKVTIYVNNGGPGSISWPTEDYLSSFSPNQILVQGLKKTQNALLFENMYTQIATLRMIKSPAEISILRKATEINVEGIKNAAKSIKSGIDERFLEGVLEGNYKMNGAQRLAFGSIIKSGNNSLWPWRILATHYNRRNRVMENGDLVILDVGCEFEYYVSDVGRTFPVSGKFNNRQKEILEMEVGIADAIINFIKPGIKFADIKKETDLIIPKDAKKYMQVGLYFGHHLGLSTDDPSIPDAKLQPGMIFTVEPWYYNHDENISVFTEDVILVTKNGCEILSKNLPRTPKELENLMQN